MLQQFTIKITTILLTATTNGNNEAKWWQKVCKIQRGLGFTAMLATKTNIPSTPPQQNHTRKRRVAAVYYKWYDCTRVRSVQASPSSLGHARRQCRVHWMVDGGRALRIPCRTLLPDTLGLLGCHAGPTVSPGGEKKKRREQYLHCQGIAMQTGKHIMKSSISYFCCLNQCIHSHATLLRWKEGWGEGGGGVTSKCHKNYLFYFMFRFHSSDCFHKEFFFHTK